MGKDSLWKRQPAAWVLSALGGFPVTRGTADREALKRCIAVLEAGEPLVLFPEGERKSGPIVQPLFDGAAYVAAQGRRADRARRHRRLGGRDAEGRQVHPPAQGARHHRGADRPATVPAAGCRAPSSEVVTDRAARRRCSGCSTRPSAASKRDVGVGLSRRGSAVSASASHGGSAAPHSSRAECIDSWGTPTSTVAMPRRVAVSGPIVEPHGMLLRDTNVWTGTPASSHACANSGAVSADVA